MRIFKTTYKDRKGRTREAADWYVEFRDHNATVRRLPAFTSKAASEEMGRNLVKLVEFHKGSGGQTDPALSRWLADLPERTRAKLVSIGLLSAERAAVSKPLADHVEDFGKALQAKGNSPEHVKLVTARVRRIVEGCAFRFYGDISASKAMMFVAELQADTPEKRGISAQTFNFYIAAIKQFCRWMVKDRRATESPVAHLDGLNVKTDRRHDRRALAVDELVRLLDVTVNGPERCGMQGEERLMLYWLAAETGLRSKELRSLSRQSFDLDGDQATVTVRAGYSKRRREDTLPLRSELAQALRCYLAKKTPNAPAFPMPDRQRVIDMLRADLDAADIPYAVEGPNGPLYADFHALRHTFITMLATSGVHPKVAQALARHSTITLTMDRYTHTLVEEQSAALAGLPDLSQPARQALQATGTDGPAVLASCLAPQGRLEGISGGAGGLTAGKAAEPQKCENPAEMQGFAGKTSGEGGIRTLGELSPTPVFETGPIGRSGTSPRYYDT